jgi:2'-5' RNA ligase
MSKVRAFVAVHLPPDVVQRVVDVQRALGAGGLRVKWVERENVHLTVKFLGDVSYEDVNGIARVLAGAAAGVEPFFLEVKGTGSFPRGGSPKVIWAGIEGDVEKLEKIFRHLNDALASFGVPRENRAFSPHVTIGRVKPGADNSQLLRALEAHGSDRFGEVKVSEVALMMSELTSRGPTYTALSRVRLGGA